MTDRRHDPALAGSPQENYERHFVPSIGAPAAMDLVEMAALRPGERVLDVACGTGIVARFASRAVGAVGTVTGVDIDPGMLAVARSATPSDVGIEWHVASAETMPFPDATFDVVLCQMGLQFVPDPGAALTEMRRVLAPGGRLALSVPGPTPPLFAVMEEALARHVGAEAANFVNRVFSLHDTERIDDLLRGAGFRDVSVGADTRSLSLPAPADFFWQYVSGTPLAAVVARASDGDRATLEREVVTNWREFVRDRALTLEVRMVVATARK